MRAEPFRVVLPSDPALSTICLSQRVLAKKKKKGSLWKTIHLVLLLSLFSVLPVLASSARGDDINNNKKKTRELLLYFK